MKIRADFVTNSSSSSFILARSSSSINEQQKEAIIQFVEQEILGEKCLTPDSTEKEIQQCLEEDLDVYYDDTKQEIRDALKNGKSIYTGWVCFEDDSAEYRYASFFQKIWKIMEENGEGNFVTIDGNLMC